MYILLFIGWRGPCTKLFLKSPTTKHNIKTFLAKNSFRTEDRRRNKTIKSVFAAWIIYKLLWCPECDLSSLSRSSICCRCLVASKQKRSCGNNILANLVAGGPQKYEGATGCPISQTWLCFCYFLGFWSRYRGTVVADVARASSSSNVASW